MADRKRARELAKDFNERCDPLGWFEPLYREARTNSALVPWADLAPNPHLVAIDGGGRRALKVGCGLGDDAEQLASWGFEVAAFDISPTAICLCRERFPASRVEYVVADLFDPPPPWAARFDFVLESYTLQVLPAGRRREAVGRICSLWARVALFSRSHAGAMNPIHPGRCLGPLLKASLRGSRQQGSGASPGRIFWTQRILLSAVSVPFTKSCSDCAQDLVEQQAKLKLLAGVESVCMRPSTSR